jgi:nitrogen fixation protein FixH
MTAQSFRLTGRRVLAMLIAFFLAIIIANAIFITLAVRSFPGEQEKKSYLQGLAYNDSLAAREAQEKLGWTAEIAGARLLDRRAEIILRFKSDADAPISGLAVSGRLARPADDKSDHALAFVATAPGSYSAVVDGLEPGAWRLTAAASNARGDRFALEKRLTLE